MNNTEIAWAAGLFDGEGSVGCYQKNRPRSPLLKISMSQAKSPYVLERFQAAIGGYGKIRYNPPRGNRSESWFWQMSCSFECLKVASTLWPYLSPPKKLQFERAFAEYNERRSVRVRSESD